MYLPVQRVPFEVTLIFSAGGLSLAFLLIKEVLLTYARSVSRPSETII
jgi:hypothetical protein